MRILHVINSLGSGGAEKLVVDICNELSSESSVGLYTLNSHNNFFLEKLNKRVLHHQNNSNNRYNLKHIYNLFKIIKNYDIVHAHLFPPLYIISLISIFYPKKSFVFTEHNTSNNRRKLTFFKLIERFIYNNFDLITCISKGTKENLEAWIGKRSNIILLYNSINLKNINKAKPSQLNFFSEGNNVILTMVGSFNNNQKRQQDIIKALPLLPKNYKLLLIGDGPKKVEYENLVEDLQLSDRVIFLGRRKDVYEILKSSDYGIIASEWEGFGLVALEYMGCNIPSLGSNVPGLNEVITNDLCLFKVGSPKDIAKKITFLEQNLLSKQSIILEQNQILKKFDIEKNISLLTSKYKSIMKNS